MQNKGYGFLPRAGLPRGHYNEISLPVESLHWAVTGDYGKIAKNHCGAVCATNLSVYFSSQGYRELLEENDRTRTFERVHNFVGDGPVLRLLNRTRKYFASRGYSFSCRKVRYFWEIRDAIGEGRPSVVLLTSGPFDWHWVLAVGCRRYEDGREYLRVVDGWHDTSDRYFLLSRNGEKKEKEGARMAAAFPCGFYKQSRKKKGAGGKRP